VQDDWWHIRAASILRKVANLGPIGVNHLASAFGGSVDRGSNPNRAKRGSRHIIRTLLQQLTAAGYVEAATNTAGSTNFGRIVTPAGHKLLDEIAHSVKDEAVAAYPGLAKY
jgi:small subunit ribosomal protein S19e